MLFQNTQEKAAGVSKLYLIVKSKIKIIFSLFFLFSSAFFLFCSEFRPKIKGEHPGLSIGDVAKKLGEMWNNTAADDKQPYEKKAAKLKEKYEKVTLTFMEMVWGGQALIYFFFSLFVYSDAVTYNMSVMNLIIFIGKYPQNKEA